MFDILLQADILATYTDVTEGMILTLDASFFSTAPLKNGNNCTRGDWKLKRQY